MKAFVFWHNTAGCFGIKPLEGKRVGEVVAHVERIRLKDAEFFVSKSRKCWGMVGSVMALWGITLRDGLSNKDVLDLCVGKPWLSPTPDEITLNSKELSAGPLVPKQLLPQVVLRAQ